MKRSEMVKRLATYMYDCNEARASDTLRFLENQGMMPRDYVWDLEEELNPTTAEEQVEALVKEHMGWTNDQFGNWYFTLNPLLGGITPNDMVCQGRHDKLIKWIKNQLDEDDSPPEKLTPEEHAQRYETDPAYRLTADIARSLYGGDFVGDTAEQEERDKELYAKHLALPKLPQKGAVKKLNALSKARRKKLKPSKELIQALRKSGKKK